MVTFRGRVLRVLVCALVSCMALGCGGYYRVKDPASGKVYHTRKIDKSRRGGFVEFKDANSGTNITLQSSEVAKISRYEYERDTSK